MQAEFHITVSELILDPCNEVFRKDDLVEMYPTAKISLLSNAKEIEEKQSYWPSLLVTYRAEWILQSGDPTGLFGLDFVEYHKQVQIHVHTTKVS